MFSITIIFDMNYLCLLLIFLIGSVFLFLKKPYLFFFGCFESLLLRTDFPELLSSCGSRASLIAAASLVRITGPRAFRLQ